MLSYTEIKLDACPCCAGAAFFKQYKLEKELYATHIACNSCGLKTNYSTFNSVTPPPNDWECYAAQAQVWNRRVCHQVTVALP